MPHGPYLLYTLFSLRVSWNLVRSCMYGIFFAFIPFMILSRHLYYITFRNVPSTLLLIHIHNNLSTLDALPSLSSELRFVSFLGCYHSTCIDDKNFLASPSASGFLFLPSPVTIICCAVLFFCLLELYVCNGRITDIATGCVPLPFLAGFLYCLAVFSLSGFLPLYFPYLYGLYLLPSSVCTYSAFALCMNFLPLDKKGLPCSLYLFLVCNTDAFTWFRWRTTLRMTSDGFCVYHSTTCSSRYVPSYLHKPCHCLFTMPLGWMDTVVVLPVIYLLDMAFILRPAVFWTFLDIVLILLVHIF
jgi:hypothetical protein